MKRSALPLQTLASTATTSASMSTRSPYRDGRKQWGRGFSDRPYNQGRGRQFFAGESHFQDFNSGVSPAGSDGYDPRQLPRPPPRFNPNQQLRQPPPFVQNQNNQFRRSPRFDQNSRVTGSPQQFRPRPPKPLDYRDWEYAKPRPPPGSVKFIVLSYNILADYLAINHRSKLYFHIPWYMLDWEWRKRSILFELNLWSADIMCLQEVDRFQDLAEELKPRGYDGIWKMRTGNAVDGCAIFWRTSRFKLLYEESIEFNQLGLRDNVAQICVLELTKRIRTANTSDLPTSSESSDKVVVCNIHVLYNPKRGEIKLGQVRTLLDKANAVARMWNAPVVLCGDFNCTPKSPLYNFILEQKLDLSGIDRDKISGQASAEIRPSWPRNTNLNPNPNSNPVTDQSSSEKSNQGPAVTVEKTEETQQSVIDNCKEDSVSTILVLADSFNKASISDNSDDKDPGNEEVVQRSEAPPSFYFEGENEFNEEAPREVNIQLEGEMPVEDRDAFLKTLDDSEVSSQLDSSQSDQPDASDPADFDVDSPTNEALNNLSNDMDRTPYDPSIWTPVEVAVATGNEECTVLQHPLKLKSSYAEVEDCSGTRDSNGEPLVTSYNRCFLGTVDYIWSSEGLQTVRVLAPIPKSAMQWTPGFPTKKWGSDHIALASELAFTKDATNNMAEVQHREE